MKTDQIHSAKVFYIDPQSMINLAKYDYYLLSGMDLPVYYFCSRYYDFDVSPKLHYKKVFAYNKKKHNWQKAASYILSYLLILLYVVRLQPRVIHIQWFRIPRFDYTFVRLLQRLFKVRVIFTAHNILPHQGNEYKSEAIFQKAYHAFDKIIVHSLATKEQMVQTFHIDADKIEVISHGVLPFNISADDYNACRKDYDRKYNLNGKIVFSALGFQNYYKGSDLLAKVWATTPTLSQNPDCRLLIIGKVNDSTIDFSMLDGLNNVIFDNRRISDEEFIYLLRHTSVYLLPYRDISQSGALLTVITEHIPVLVTDTGGMAEPLAIGHIGWIIPPSDEQALRDMLVHLVANPAEIQAVRNDQDAWNKVCNHYDWKNISRQTQQLYKSFM